MNEYECQYITRYNIYCNQMGTCPKLFSRTLWPNFFNHCDFLRTFVDIVNFVNCLNIKGGPHIYINTKKKGLKKCIYLEC